MANKYDYGETVSIYSEYRKKGGAPIAQSTASVTITDSTGTARETDTAMTEDATGIYSYDYVLPATGPAGIWTYTTTGTDASGYKTINTVSFVVKALVTPYTIPDTVREMLPELLVAEDNIGTVASGTSITLTNPVYGVPTILQDTTTLYESIDYTFIQPQAVTLLTAATGENYTANIHIGFSDPQLIKRIARSDRIINDAFSGHTAPTADYKDDWSATLTVVRILRDTSRGDPDTLKWAASLEKTVWDAMRSQVTTVALPRSTTS